MTVFLTIMSWSNENKSCMKIDGSLQARVCMTVFLTLMSWSNENKSCENSHQLSTKFEQAEN